MKQMLILIGAVLLFIFISMLLILWGGYIVNTGWTEDYSIGQSIFGMIVLSTGLTMLVFTRMVIIYVIESFDNDSGKGSETKD